MIDFEPAGIDRHFRAHHANLDAIRRDATSLELGRVEMAKRSGGKLREPQVIEKIIQRNVAKRVAVGAKHNAQEEEYRDLYNRQKQIRIPLSSLEGIYSTEYTVKPEGSKKELSRLRQEDRRIIEKKKKLSEELDRSNNGIIGSQKMSYHAPGTRELASK